MSLVSKKKIEGSIPVIPDEIIHYDILARLPPKSVLKFKSVCQSWYNLTNSTSFLNAHKNYNLSKSPESADLMIIWYNNRSCYYTYLDAPHSKSGTIHALIDINEIHSYKIAEIVGSSNGLVCFKLGEPSRYMLCNPITREFSGLIWNDSEYIGVGYRHCKSGFGYDYLSGDYKIVNIVNTGKFQEGNGAEVEFYSTSGNSWKQYYQILDPSIFPFWQSRHNKCAVINNKLHWIIGRTYYYKNEDTQKYKILTFDLHTQEIAVMSFPIKINDGYHLDLMVSINGRLFLVATPFEYYNGVRSVELWEMKRYGEAQSWMMNYKININVGEQISKVITCRSTSEGGEQVLLENNNELVWYGTENKSIRKVNGGRSTANPWLCKPTLTQVPAINLA